MAGFTSAIASTASAATYAGLARVFEYVNQDGRLTRWNCGQAAATTLLTHHGNPSASMRDIERDYPPDILGGWLGTSRRRVCQICKAHAMPLREVCGEAALRSCLQQGTPVIVMLAVPAGKVLGREVPGGHWMVAYGFDDSSIYLTNWGSMTWDAFRRGWRSLISRAVQMNERGLAAKIE